MTLMKQLISPTDTDSEKELPYAYSKLVTKLYDSLCAFSLDIARTVGDRKLIDSARINLGMARGNMSMNKYMGVVKDNLPALLNWKTRRQQFKATTQ